MRHAARRSDVSTHRFVGDGERRFLAVDGGALHTQHLHLKHEGAPLQSQGRFYCEVRGGGGWGFLSLVHTGP